MCRRGWNLAAVSSLLMDIVRGLPSDIGFLISKGITSNDVLSTGLALTSARLLGQYPDAQSSVPR